MGSNKESFLFYSTYLVLIFFSGFLRAENQVYLIEPLEDSVKGDHAVYKQEHLRTKRATFGYINDTVYDYGAAPRLAGLYKSRNMVLQD